jgi:hypothetical protein
MYWLQYDPPYLLTSLNLYRTFLLLQKMKRWLEVKMPRGPKAHSLSSLSSLPPSIGEKSALVETKLPRWFPPLPIHRRPLLPPPPRYLLLSIALFVPHTFPRERLCVHPYGAVAAAAISFLPPLVCGKKGEDLRSHVGQGRVVRRQRRRRRKRRRQLSLISDSALFFLLHLLLFLLLLLPFSRYSPFPGDSRLE